MTVKENTKYNTDKTGGRIINIPYEKFISKSSLPENVIWAYISEKLSGEENSKIINNTIDICFKNGGGTVAIPKGNYKISTVYLKSNVTLFISDGAVLTSLTLEENEHSETPIDDAVIKAQNANNIRITGGGTICGSGLTYVKEPATEEPFYALREFNLHKRVIEARRRIHFAKTDNRSFLLHLIDCENVVVDNVILKDSAFWTFVVDGGKNTLIENLIIDNNMYIANADGIDIVGGENINIRNCFIVTADDALVFKPIEKSICDVNISNCTVSSYANCFKIGTETVCDIKNVNVNNCEFFIADGMTYGYSGIAIESCDGSNVSNIIIDNINMTGISAPILIWLGSRMKYGEKQTGSVENIKISNVTAVNTELASAVTGCIKNGTEYKVKNVTLKNINASYRDSEENLNILNTVTEMSMYDYPEITRVSHFYYKNHEESGYWDLPCYGIYIRHAENIDYETYKCVPRSVNNRSFSVEE